MANRTFILMRNQKYADQLAKNEHYIVRKTESELMGIRPLAGDRFIIDAHFSGNYSELNGLELINRFIQCHKQCEIAIQVCSWFPEAYLLTNYNALRGSDSIDIKYIQLPL